MDHLRLKYQQLLTTLLLSAYLMGNFSLPIFEGVHFLLHLGDDAPLHSFQSHDTQHQHQVLTSIDELVSNNSSTEFPVDNSIDYKYKKIVQQLTVSELSDISIITIKTSNFSSHFKSYPLPFLGLKAPPPKV